MTARLVTQLTSQWVLQEQGTPWASNIYSDPKQWSCWSMEGEVMFMFSEDKLKKKKKWSEEIEPYGKILLSRSGDSGQDLKDESS